MSIPFSTRKGRAFAFILGAFGVAYPFLVYAGIGRTSPAAFVALALAVLAMRGIWLRSDARILMSSGLLAAVGLGLLALLWVDGMVAAKAYPVLMSAAAAGAFGWSLAFPPTLVERIAALAGTAIDGPARRYMRRVTMVWCGFLAANAALSAWTATVPDPAVWALYNGLVSYLLMGLLMGGEFLVRRWVRRRATGGAA